MKSFLAKKADIKPKWHVVDAEGKILGRLASKIAPVLMGKTKPIYTPNVDTGDYVIVVNAEKIRIGGKKADVKEYQTYSGYPGGQKIIPYKKMLEKQPEKIIELAVKRMLPKNKLGTAMLKKLKVFAGPDHNHAAQNPEKLEI